MCVPPLILPAAPLGLAVHSKVYISLLLSLPMSSGCEGGQHGSSTPSPSSDFSTAQFFAPPFGDSPEPAPQGVGGAAASASAVPFLHRMIAAAAMNPLQNPFEETTTDDSCKTQCFQCFSSVCKKRVMKHPRGVVCKVHHDFISCSASCGSIVHLGCVIETISGLSMMPDPGIPWLCPKCTPRTCLPPSKTEPPECAPSTVDKKDANIAEARSKYKTKTFFENRQALFDHMRMAKWTCSSGGEKPWLYFRCGCGKGGKGACSLKFAASATDATELEHGEWSVKDLPTSHACVVAIAPPLLATHAKSLSREVFKEIQRLSCSKAFQTSSIQRHIQTTYSTLVDTKLIYNIGYRARTKLGLDEMEMLFKQKEVYTLISAFFIT
jgi:hypothetical protein